MSKRINLVKKSLGWSKMERQGRSFRDCNKVIVE
jgi:hypothetical protein